MRTGYVVGFFLVSVALFLLGDGWGEVWAFWLNVVVIPTFLLAGVYFISESVDLLEEAFNRQIEFERRIALRPTAYVVCGLLGFLVVFGLKDIGGVSFNQEGFLYFYAALIAFAWAIDRACVDRMCRQGMIILHSLSCEFEITKGALEESREKEMRAHIKKMEMEKDLERLENELKIYQGFCGVKDGTKNSAEQASDGKLDFEEDEEPEDESEAPAESEAMT